MKQITTIVLILSISNVIAQSEKPIYQKIANEFENNYNKTEYKEIFNSFSSEMQNALPLDKTIAFFSGLQSQAGKIKNKEFIRFHSSYALYKTTFEQGIFALNISLDNNSKINGFYIEPFVELPQMERNITKVKLPFKGEWTVVWGGDTKELNYHVESKAQKNAFDFVITDLNGQTYKTDGQTNEDYYAFGKEILAPCDAKVVLVVDGVKDNKPGILNPIYVPGNTVILKTENNEFLFFAHFKQHSIVVEQGEKVTQGQLLGLCGNSGNSSEPHLHFHIQNIENMNIATGVKCYFEKLIVNGEIKKDYSPIKGDKIKPVE